MSLGTQAAAAFLAAAKNPRSGTVALTFSTKTLISVSAGTPTFGTATTTTGYAWVLPAYEGQNMPGAWGKGLQSASLAGKVLKFLWVSASGMAFVPKSDDTVSIDGATWVVLGCDPYPLSRVDVSYGVGVQKQ
jgi:hypothetical protein